MTTGNTEIPWTGGATGCGKYYKRVWSGGDASAAEKADEAYLPHFYNTTVSRINSPFIHYKNALSGATGDGYVQQLFGSMPQAKDPWTSNHWNALVSELYAQIKGGDFNASVTAAQLGETLDGISNAATRIYRAYKAARKGRLRDAAVALTGANRKGFSNKAATKETASNWLELQYGWLPLLGDVHSGAELLANYLHRPITRTVRVRKRARASLSGEPSHNFWSWGEHSVLHKCQIIAILTEDLTGYQTLGLTDPFSVAWELVPYSFVIDWFYPIGPWLEAANAARTLKGTFVVTDTVISKGRGISSGSIYQIQGGDSYLSFNLTVNRTISQALQPRIPAIKPLGKIASLGHCLNALALLENLRR